MTRMSLMSVSFVAATGGSMLKRILGFVGIGLLMLGAWACAGRNETPVHAVVLISANAEWSVIRTLVPGLRFGNSPFGEYFARSFDLPDGSRESVIFLHGGWGKVNAAASTQYAVDRWNPDVLINLGTCGGFEGGIQRGAIILATRTVIYDIIERMGDAEEAVKEYASDLDLRWLKRPLPMPVLETVLVSADQDIDPKAMGALRTKYGAVAADWESGAIACVARQNAKRLLILRGVTDLVSESGGEAYGNIEVFRKNSETVLKTLFESLPAWLAAAK
jgi:adenosylhomocysteine nucleosidase